MDKSTKLNVSDSESLEEAGSYPWEGLEEISLPTATESVLELLGTEEVPESLKGVKEAEPPKSRWEAVMEQRRLKRQLYYRKIRKRKKGPKKKYRTYWMKKNRKRELNWRYYHLSLAADPWKKQLRSWQVNKVEVRISEQEFRDWLEKEVPGGYLAVARIVCFEKVALKENFLVVDKDKKVLYRGTRVPESYPAYGRWIKKG